VKQPEDEPKGTSSLANELAALDAVAQADLVTRRELKPIELVEAAIQRIEALNPTLNAVVTTAFDEALDAARAVTVDVARPFAGVPFLLKDLIVEAKGMRFTEGSLYLGDNVSTHDQELVVRLRRAGFAILGKTNTPEFGMAPHCEPARFGATLNPWNTQHTTAGSSGGSASAVASGMVPAAHANDLGGSIRYPAACCGLFGLKPTRARVPLGPEYADPIGAMAVEHAVTRTVRDSAAILDVISGSELGEPFPAPHRVRPFLDEVGAPPGRLRVAYSTVAADGHPTDPDCVTALQDAVELCEQLGHIVEEQWLPPITPDVGGAIGATFGAAVGWIIAYWIRKLEREPRDGELEPLTRAFWELGKTMSATDYLMGLELLRTYSRRVAQFFEKFDMWLTPALAQPPPRIGEMLGTETDPFAGLRRSNQFVAFPGVVANITGNPAMSVPLYWNSAGLPIGVHFLARFGDEATLFRLAAQLESARPWAQRRPPIFA
jgi:amidase